MKPTLLIMAFLLALPLPALAKSQLPPNVEKLQKLLVEKLKQIKARDRYAMPGKTTRRHRPSRRNLFRVKLGTKAIDYSKLDKVVLPVNPVKFLCTDENVAVPKGGYSYVAGRVKSKLRWAKDYLGNSASNYRYSAVDRCNKALYNIMTAYCMSPRDADVLKMYYSASKMCLREYKRAWITALLTAEKKPVPLWAVSPDALKEQVKNKLRWATSYLKDTSRWYSSMLDYLDILKVYPKNFDAINGFAYMYANYYGVTKAEADSHRKNNMLGGKFARLSKQDLYKKAIDELLAKHHSLATPDTPKLGLSYLDVNYLLTMVYLPEIRKHQAELQPYKCSETLRRNMRAYDKAAVTAAMASDRSACKGYNAEVTGSDIMRYPKVRMKLIEILSKHTADPAGVLAEAATRIAGQVGAPRSRVCWLWENPYPESIKPSAGKNAHCSAIGGKMHNVRPGFYNYVYSPIPVKKLTKLQIQDAREILAMGGQTGKALDNQFKKAHRRAKGIQCLAWEVTVAQDYHGRGRYGKMYRYSNGGPKKISCGSMGGNAALKKLFKGWNNHFDTVVGGKMKSHWRVIRNYWRKILRQQRPAVIYVKRKI
ncbi:hypothetical protein KKF84_14420 [Myxococcota bacterium]|nr:hypothetical protein [Myxococcota bacterium]MBU1536517.1 hypothetical protein [Myxococcota bacterium]